MNARPFLNLSTERRMVMTFALKQALEILQMPQQELSQWLLDEIEKNPLLELNRTSSPRSIEIDLPAPPNLYEHIQNQIRENFSNPKDQLLAGLILEQIDERGFLTTSLETISQKPLESILSVLQTFDPPGIFARTLQESLLIQLRAKGRCNPLTYQLVETCFEDLLHGRYTVIKKKLGSADLGAAISELSRLSLRPANAFKHEPITPIYPDLQITKIEGGWTLELVEDLLPKFHLKNEYLELSPETREEKEALRDFKTGAKWLFRSLNRRRKLLLEIGRILLCKQAPFLEQKGSLIPHTATALAEKLEVHESTISRALAGKYISTPRGILPLRSLISADPSTQNARDLLALLIQSENKQSPLTDDELAQELRSRGFPVARRTIAKYRSQLKLGSATQRKHILRP